MLRLPEFSLLSPPSVADAVTMLAEPGVLIVAGGTDLLPNLKHKLRAPASLLSLHRLDELKQSFFDEQNQVLRLGTMMTLTDVSLHPVVRERFPSLARAASLVASPLIRNTATLGGNVHLDTRCRYVNQTQFWRSAIGGCLKSEGDVCHVVPAGRNCVAANSSDTVPVLITLDAELTLVSARGQRQVLLADYFQNDGRHHLQKQPDELATEIRVPLPRGPRKSSYTKWTVRHSIDFPLISVAQSYDLEPGTNRLLSASVCINVLAGKPRVVSRPEALIGQVWNAEVVAEQVRQWCKHAKPLDNVPYDAEYRRRVLPVFVTRELLTNS